MSALATLSIVLLCAAAVCIKLSSAALAVPMALGAMWLYVARTDATRLRRATFWWSCSLAAALAITWVGRNVILSGCPLYPSPFLSLPVDWRYTSSAGWAGTDDFRSSGADVRIGMLRRAVSSPQFASVPGFLARPIRAAAMNSTGVMAWLISMLFASFIEVALPALITLFALIALLLARLRRQRIDGSMRTGPRMIEWLIGLPSIIGLVTWFIVSPEPRYAVSSFWILAAGLTALLLRNTLHATRLIAIACVLAIMPIGYRILILKFNPISGSMSNVIFIPAGPDHGMHPVPTVPMLTVKTKWGLELLIPRDSGPMWDPPLPSTSMNFPRLMLRTPDDYESGFIVN